MKTKTHKADSPSPARNMAIQKYQPLSELMIATLFNASRKQRMQIPFGPGDINGAFFALVEKQLIRLKRNHQNNVGWYVTEEACELLSALGEDISYTRQRNFSFCNKLAIARGMSKVPTLQKFRR